MPRGKPTDLDKFLARGLAEPSSNAPAAAAPAEVPAAAAPAAMPLPTRRKSKTVSVSVRGDYDAVLIIDAYAEVRRVAPHALYRHALAQLAAQLVADTTWQAGLDADTLRDVQRSTANLES